MQSILTALPESNILIALSLLTLPVKAIALWQASRLSHKWWFVALFVVNTLGILDCYYIFFVARKYQVETKEVDSH